MKVKPECALCLFHRGYLEILEATQDPELRLETCRLLLRMMSENFQSSSVPSVIGTKRERLVKEATRNFDPFAKQKQLSNKEAMKFLPLARKIVAAEKTAKAHFRKACLCAIVGNIMEFNIPGHTFRFDDIGGLIQEAEKDLVIDNITEAFMIAQKSSLILYLTDNAGEIAFDTLLVNELKNLGSRVVVAVKGKPAYNDATMEDAMHVGMDKIADDLITTGTDSMGLILSDCSRRFLRFYKSADFVVAKGMGYAETLTEFDPKTPHLLLLRTKCANVADYFKVGRQKNVAKLLCPNKT